MKSCKDITLLVEKGKITKISFREKMQVKFHLAMCKLCRNFAVDSAFLDRVLSRLKPGSLKLTDEEKDNLKTSLNRDKVTVPTALNFFSLNFNQGINALAKN